MATTVLGLKTFAASDPVDYNEVNDNYNKIDNGVKTAMQGRASYNWLDNSYFRNFINQRGEISTAGVWNYCIDRWRAVGTAGQLVWHNSDHIALGALRGISQALKNKNRFIDKSWTLAVMDVGGVISTVNGVFGGDNNAIYGVQNGLEIRLYSVGDDDNVYFNVNNLNADTSAYVYLAWAALYEGSYTADTLPAYVPKGYAAELAECQRYYYQSNDNKYGQDGMIIRRAISIEGNTSSFCLESVDLPVTMRITPTITIYDDDGNANAAKEWYTNDKVSNTSIRYANNRSFCVASESGEFVGGKSYFFQYAASADL